MAFQVDQCKNFKDGRKCEKCGRMMPAYCKDQQDLEDKARLYDEWVASQEMENGSKKEAETVREANVDVATLSEPTETRELPAAASEVTQRRRGRTRR